MSQPTPMINGKMVLFAIMQDGSFLHVGTARQALGTVALVTEQLREMAFAEPKPSTSGLVVPVPRVPNGA